MKKSKILIAVFAVIAAASAARAEVPQIDFDGKKNAPMFAQLLSQTQELPAAEPAGIPARVFTAPEQVEMDRSIASAITYVQTHKQNAKLAESFECLRRKGTLQEKFDFVYQPEGSIYSFPEVCISRDKGICSWVVESVCKTITAVSCAWVTSGDNPPVTKKECHDEAKEDCKEVKNWVCS